MAKFCPLVKHNVTYLTCLECEEKVCKENKREITKEKRSKHHEQNTRL